MKPARTERTLLLAGIVLVLISTAWFGRKWLQAEPRPGAGPGAGAGQRGPDLSLPKLKSDVASWPAPQAQARGPGWVYGLFTPPEIFYDASTRQFSVAGGSASAKPTEDRFGLELLRVNRVPFRLQLLGHLGGPNDRLGLFENMTDASTLVLRPGARVAALGLVVEQIEILPTGETSSVGGSLREPVAVAIVKDERSGQTVRLRQGEQTLTDTLQATVRLGGGQGELHEVSPGDQLQDAGGKYIIHEIRLTPPELTVTKETVAPDRKESKVLTPITTAIPPLP